MKKYNISLMAILIASSFLITSCTGEEIEETNDKVDNLTLMDTKASARFSLSNFTIKKGVLSGITDEAILRGKLIIPDNVTLIAKDDNGNAISIFTKKQKQLLQELVVGDNENGREVTIGEYCLDGCSNLNKITFGRNVKEVSGFIIHKNFNIKTVVWKKTTTEGIDFWTFPFGLDVKDYEENGIITPNSNKIDLKVPAGLLSHFGDWESNFKSIKEYN